MAWELSITSAPRGLKPGSAGFCPVAHTQNMPPLLIERLETISGYRHVEIGAGSTQRNPVVWSHTILRLSSETFHVLSRICDAGRDYSGRSNRFAYHLVLKPRELVPAGPAALLQTPGLLREQWDGQVCLIPHEKDIPKLTSQPRPCATWERVLGDAGWAGILVQKFFNDSQKTIYFVYPAEVDILKLFGEAIALLPAARRWNVTFSTFYQGLAEVVLCRWRALPEHAPEVAEVLRKQGLEVWDLRTRRGPAPSLPEAVAAREGRLLELPTPQKVSVQVRDVPLSQTAAPTVVSPLDASAAPKQDLPYLQLAENPETPPPLWVTSKTSAPLRERRHTWSLLINLAMLLIGLLVGLGTGFVLWSGLLIPRFLPGCVENAGKSQEPEINEEPQQGPPAEKPGRPQPEDRGSSKALSAKEPQPKKVNDENHGKPAPQASSKEQPSEKPVTSHASKPEPSTHDETPANNPSQQQARPNKGDQTSKSQPIDPPPKDGEAANSEISAIPLEELTLSQVSELRYSQVDAELPGGEKVASWKSTIFWDVEEWRKKADIKAGVAVLKISEKRGQPRYYVQTPEPIRTEEITVGRGEPLSVNRIPGINLELRRNGGWNPGSSPNEYLLLVNNRERVQLKISQHAANITVETHFLETKDAEKQLPDKILAEIGFYLTDEETNIRVWVPLIKLIITGGQADQRRADERQKNGGTP